jgi:hypothetical protein
MTDRQEELLQARVDGELTSAERLELERLLAEDASTRVRAGELDALAQALNLLGPEDPPARVLRTVIDHVHHNATDALHESQTTSTGGLMRTKVLWGLAAAAGIALAVLSYTGFPPESGGSEGAIGAAKRYQAGQIAASDVKLGDQAAQEFLQSDLFDKLVRDDNARKLLNDSNFKQLAASVEFRSLVGRQQFKNLVDSKALFDVNVGAALSDLDLAEQLNSLELADAFANENFMKALSDIEFREGLRMKGFSADTALKLKAHVSDEIGFKDQLRRQGMFDTMLKSQAFLKALNSLEFRQALATESFAKAFSSLEFKTALDNEQFRSLVSDAGFRDMLQRQGLAKMMGDQNFKIMASNGALELAMKSDTMMRALNANGFSQALQTSQFATALGAYK